MRLFIPILLAALCLFGMVAYKMVGLFDPDLLESSEETADGSASIGQLHFTIGGIKLHFSLGSHDSTNAVVTNAVTSTTISTHTDAALAGNNAGTGAIAPATLMAPRIARIKQLPFDVGDTHIYPKASYDLTARVLTNARSPVAAAFGSTSLASTATMSLGWGFFSPATSTQYVKIKNGGVDMVNCKIGVKPFETNMAAALVMPANDQVAKAMSDLPQGGVAHFQGYLVDWEIGKAGLNQTSLAPASLGEHKGLMSIIWLTSVEPLKEAS